MRTFDLIGQVKTGIFSLGLSRHLDINYDTAWLLSNKILRAKDQREQVSTLRGTIRLDGAYLDGERPGGTAGRESKNKIPILTAPSLNEERGIPSTPKLRQSWGSTVGRSPAALAAQNLAWGCMVLSKGLACCRPVTRRLQPPGQHDRREASQWAAVVRLDQQPSR